MAQLTMNLSFDKLFWDRIDLHNNVVFTSIYISDPNCYMCNDIVCMRKLLTTQRIAIARNTSWRPKVFGVRTKQGM